MRKTNPYDLFNIAAIHKKHKKVKHFHVTVKQPYELDCPRSAYDLSKRPDFK